MKTIVANISYENHVFDNDVVVIIIVPTTFDPLMKLRCSSINKTFHLFDPKRLFIVLEISRFMHRLLLLLCYWIIIKNNNNKNNIMNNNNS